MYRIGENLLNYYRAPKPTRFINEQFIRRRGDETEIQRQRFNESFMNLPAGIDPRFWTTNTLKPHDPSKWIPLNILGEGGFGVASLWRYNDPESKHHGLHIVIKTARPGRGEADMEIEGKVMETLSKRSEEHLVNMLYAGSDFKKLYLEYCTGGDLSRQLRKAIKSKDKIDEEEIWRLILCLAKGLNAMEKLEPTAVIHYDLKPENVLIDTDPVIHRCEGDNLLYKIADFGLALAQGKGPPATGTLQHARGVGIRGTGVYFSPEMFAWRYQYIGRPAVDIENEREWERLYGLTPKLDIWAIGVIAWQFMMKTSRPPTNGISDRVLGIDNKYYCPPNRFVIHGGHSYGPKIVHSGYSQDLISIVQWCLMKSRHARCNSTQLLTHAQTFVDSLSEVRIEKAAQAARIEESRKRLAMGAQAANQISLQEIERRVQEDLKRKRAERYGRMPDIDDELSSIQQEETVLEIYSRRLEQLLDLQKRTKDFYTKKLRKLPLGEQARLLDAFKFLEGDNLAYIKYEASEKDIETEDLLLTYQLAFEASSNEIERCWKAYSRRVDTTYSNATRMTLVLRQRKYEGSPQYKFDLLERFEKRHRNGPGFMDDESDLTKMRVQRAFESQLPFPDRQPVPNIDKAERRRLIDAWEERIANLVGEGEYEEFDRNARRAGYATGEQDTQAIRMQIAWERQQQVMAEGLSNVDMFYLVV